jgi:hypothetical protein
MSNINDIKKEIKLRFVRALADGIIEFNSMEDVESINNKNS